MIELYIRNVQIATFEENEISFDFENPVFFLEELSLSRTSNFELPVLLNNSLFNYNLKAEFDGIREKIDAELRYTGGKIDGKLYVIDYTNDGDNSIYTCCFVYGELLDLKRVKELGNLSDYVHTETTLSCYGRKPTIGGQTGGNFQSNLSWMWYLSPVSYSNALAGYVNISPCVKLKYLIDIATPDGVTVNYNNTLPDRFGVILSSSNAVTNSLSFRIEGDIVNPTLTGGVGVLSLKDGYIKIRTGWTSVLKYGCKIMKATIACKIYFKSNRNIVVIKANSNNVCNRDFVSIGLQDLPKVQNLYSDQYIEFAEGEAFILAPASEWIESYGGTFSSSVITKNISAEFTYEADVADSVQYANNDTGVFSLQNNLPGVSFLDLLNTLAALTNTGVRYDAATSTFSFFDYNFSNITAIDISNILINVEKLERTCCDYAQKNIIDCDSEDYVDDNSKFKLIRNVRNDYIDDEKTIFQIPFSEGVCKVVNSVKLCYIDDWTINDAGDGYENGAGKDTLVMANAANSGYAQCLHINTLHAIGARVNDNLSNIMNEGVKVTVSVRITLRDFINITYNTVYVFEGQKYVVFKGTFADGIAELVLQKLP